MVRRIKKNRFVPNSYPLGGNDDKGTVYDYGKYVKRKIIPDYFKKSIEIYSLYKKSHLETLGVVKTNLILDQKSYVHQKHIITYPHEWPYLMFRDSIIFQLILVKNLRKTGLTLKDYLPNNVLFEFTKPVFVDFLSLIKLEDLNEEKWLNDAISTQGKRHEILLIENMLVPYLLLPLLMYSVKEYKRSRYLLRYKACNMGRGRPEWKDLFQTDGIWNLELLVKVIKFRLLTLLFKKNYFKIIDYYLDIIKKINFPNSTSGYSSYYKEKGEDFSLESKKNWKKKQKFVYNKIKLLKPKTVLDIGSNTGWYSRLSEKMGASVIATDSDEDIINSLYETAKVNKLKILPLFLPFRDFLTMSADIIPATIRMKSDMVLCLALLHHLVLGEGIELEIIIKTLSKLSREACILEFVDFADEKIRNEPDFFANIKLIDEKKYNLKKIISLGKKYFEDVKVYPSTEITRSLILLKGPKNRILC